MREKAFIFTGICLVALALFFHLFPLYWKSTTRTEYYDVESGQGFEVTIRFEKDEIVEAGYLTVKHGSVGSWDERVRFYIMNPYGAIIHDAGMVVGRHNFAFTAEHSGVYSFYFDNSDSNLNKRIFLYLRVRSPIHEDLPVVGALGIGVFALGILDLYHKGLREKLNDNVVSSRTECGVKATNTGPIGEETITGIPRRKLLGVGRRESLIFYILRVERSKENLFSRKSLTLKQTFN